MIKIEREMSDQEVYTVYSCGFCNRKLEDGAIKISGSSDVSLMCADCVLSIEETKFLEKYICKCSHSKLEHKWANSLDQTDKSYCNVCNCPEFEDTEEKLKMAWVL